jgi:hypothetical protein
MKVVLTRGRVYDLIDDERAYQSRRWNEDTTASGGNHTPTEWLVYMQHYLNRAIAEASTNADPEAAELVMDNIRKITAMGVAAMEQNGCPPRQGKS